MEKLWAYSREEPLEASIRAPKHEPERLGTRAYCVIYRDNVNWTPKHSGPPRQFGADINH